LSILPDLISELEWHQLRDWEPFIALLRRRAQAMLNENERLRERAAHLERTGGNPRAKLPERGPPRDARIR
jgi:hypothetical protein